jgi:molybdate transport system substrate-binding protein
MRALRFRGLLLAVLSLAALPAGAEPPANSPAGRVAAEEAVFPPWQNGTNNDAPNKGLVFTVPPVDTMVDFHGNVTDTALVIYASGNNFFAYKRLVDLFGSKYPDWQGRIFYETLPPGLLLKQLQNGGTVTSGNLTFTAKPDIMMAERTASETWVKQGFLVDPVVSFATNDLTIMVRAGNPEHIKGLEDLGKPRIVLAMPNPAFEGVAGQITTALQKAGGDALANAVYDHKVEDGTTILTRIHHRQTPLWLMQGRVEAGVTWRSEALFQEQNGNPIAHVDIPDEQNATATYSAAMAANAPHPYVAKAWLDFIKSDEAFAVLQPYGFKRYAP